MNKKILCTFALLTLASTSSFAASEDTWYITGSLGGLKASNVKFKEENGIRPILKSKINVLGFIGGGYNINENFRADATFFFANPEYKEWKGTMDDNGTKKDVSKKFKANAYGVMATAYVGQEISEWAEVFIGPSIGCSRISSKMTIKKGDQSEEIKLKDSKNFAFGITAGIGFNMEDIGKIDIQYRYIDFGKTSKKIKGKDKGEVDEEFAIRAHAVTIGFRRDL